jgi:hypothetical protein
MAVSVTAPMLVEQHQADQVHSQPKAAHYPKQVYFDSQSTTKHSRERKFVMLWFLTKKDYNEQFSYK